MENVMYVDESGRQINQPEPAMPSPPMITNNGDKADLLEKIDPTAIVDVIRHKLMGEELINGVWTPQPYLKDRALTKKGAWDISTLMLPVSSQNVSISKLKDDEIRRRTLNVARTAMIMCVKNWKEYGIKGTDQLHFVNEIVFSNTFITLKQPESEGIRKLIMGTIAEQKVRREDESEKKGWGLFGRK